MTAAFKEWAVVVDALGRGDQIFILRKGGIHEGREGFQPEYERFALFPTLFHQQRESVIERAQKRFDEISPFLPPPETLRLQYWAELVEAHQIDDFDAVRRLAGEHIWRDEVLEARFEWGKSKAIFALALRVFRLPTILELPMLPEYGGCKSWVQLAHPVVTAGSSPAIGDGLFREKWERLRSALRTTK